MKKFFYLIPLFLLIFISCEKSIKGEGNSNLAQDYKVEPFTDVAANGKFKLILIPNDSAYVSVQTHRNLIENMDIYVQNKTLKIGEKKKIDSFESYVVYLYYNNQLDDLTIGEKVLMESSGKLTFDQLDITAKDESIVQQFVINAKESDFTVENKAELNISGVSTSVDLKAKDYAKVGLEGLDVKVLDVDLSGEADVLANVNKELKGRVLNNSTLTFIGSAVKDVNVKDKGEIINK